MRRISSAIQQRQRPTAAILAEGDPFNNWEKLDYILQDAYYTMEQERCDICKNPVWLCHSTDNRIEFEIVKRTCYAKAEIEDYEERHKNQSKESGEYILAKPVGLEIDKTNYEPLPPRHVAYEKMQ